LPVEGNHKQLYADIKIQSRILQSGNKIAETSASEALSQAPFWRYLHRDSAKM
jgi:hypothetical protein